MSWSSAIPERLLRYAGDVLPYEQAVLEGSATLEERLVEFQRRSPEYGFCATPRGPDIARHARRGITLAEWVASVGAGFLAADRSMFDVLPGAVRTVSDTELASYLAAVGAFPLLEQREGYDAGVAYALRVDAAIGAGEGDVAAELLRGLAAYVDNRAFLRGVFLALGPLDDLEARIDRLRDRGNLLQRFAGGAWDATTGLVSTAWGLTGRVLHDPGGWADNWGNLGSSLWWGVRNPDDFALAVIDWEGLKDDPARWLGGLVPDAALVVATGGAGAAVVRGGSATRMTLRAAARGLRSAENLGDIMRALRPIASGVRTDVESRWRTLGGRELRWTPVGYVDEAGNVASVSVGIGRGPLARLSKPLGHDPTTTFRSGQYLVRRAQQPMTLHRVGSPGRPLGNYWTAIEPRGPLQAQIDSALRPDWGNTAQEVTTIRIPAGTTLYEGLAGPQPLRSGDLPSPHRSGLLGGGHQVFVPDVTEGWIVGRPRPFLRPSAG